MLARHYLTILTIHCFWRWIVLASLVAAAATGLRGLATRRPFAPTGRVVCRLTVAAVDVQILLGLCLYAVNPLARAAWANMAGAMEQQELRFFSVEHVTVMLLAVVAAHAGSWRARHARADRFAYLYMTGWFATSLACVLIGIPWWRPLLRALN